MNCLETKIIDATGPLKPLILNAILNLYKKGINRISARELKAECYDLDSTKDWNARLPAICNGMRNVIECGWKIVSEDRNFNDFTIKLFEKHKSLKDFLEINNTKSFKNIFKETKEREELNNNPPIKKDFQNLKKLDWSKIKDKNRKKLLIIGCSSSKQPGGNLNSYTNYDFGELLENHRKLRLEYYKTLFNSSPDYFEENLEKYRKSLTNNKILEAYKRYNGDFYTNDLRALYKRANEEYNFSILILSGLYGLLDFKDYIKDYHLEIKKGGRTGNDWNNDDIENTILLFNKENKIEDEDIFYCISDSYKNALKPKDNWNNLWVGNDRGKNSAKLLAQFISEVLIS